MFKKILEDTEEHIDWIKEQHLIEVKKLFTGTNFGK